MKVKTLVVNAIIAALYFVISLVIQPIGFKAIQFRIPEMFNHLIVFNKKYFFGIVLGVILANFFLSPMPNFDLIYGVGQSIIALLITIGVSHFIKNIWGRMIVNTIVFTFTMFIIAYELQVALGFPFLYTWLTTAIGELVVMAIGAPIFYNLNKRVHFENQV